MKQATVSAVPPYKEFHPRWYRPRVSVYWWLGQWRYLQFILRELSSVFVALSVVLLLLELQALRRGPEAYLRLQQRLHSPFAIALAVVTFFFVVFHTITWFNLAPVAMPVKVGGKRVPDFLVAAANYAFWVVASAAIAWVILR